MKKKLKILDKRFHDSIVKNSKTWKKNPSPLWLYSTHTCCESMLVTSKPNKRRHETSDVSSYAKCKISNFFDNSFYYNYNLLIHSILLVLKYKQMRETAYSDKKYSFLTAINVLGYLFYNDLLWTKEWLMLYLLQLRELGYRCEPDVEWDCSLSLSLSHSDSSSRPIGVMARGKLSLF